MSLNPNEFSVEIHVERNDRGFPENVNRTVAVEAGSVDINEIVEDMISSLQQTKNF